MQVFVSESLVGGALIGTPISESMRREGLAMLQAVAADIARLPNWTPVTTLEIGITSPIAGDVIAIRDAAHEATVFEQLLMRVDAVLIIAPETDGILAERCRTVRASQAASWNCSPESIDLCGDKLAFATHLQSHDLPTIPTTLADLSTDPVGSCWPRVLKPRDGAGSNLTILASNLAEWEQATLRFRQAGIEHKCLSQPFIPGRNLSVGVNIRLDGRRVECMRVGEQRLSSDGQFHYLGGCVPALISPSMHRKVEWLIEKTCHTIPGLAGYIGFDILLPEQGEPLIVELNPRLTTSYVGYRQLYATPLPERWLSMDSVSLKQQITSVEWDVSTEFRI